MTIDEALDGAEVSEREALRELRKHGFGAFADSRVIGTDKQRWVFAWSPDTLKNEPVACADEDGEFNSADIMAWLGY